MEQHMARYKPYNANQSRLVPITLREHIFIETLEEANLLNGTLQGLR